MTETEVRKSGRKALIAKRPMARVSRAVEKGETQGFMKVLVDAETKEILGASLLGTECDEVIHSTVLESISGIVKDQGRSAANSCELTAEFRCCRYH